VPIVRDNRDELFLFVFSPEGISISNQNTRLMATRAEVEKLKSVCEQYLQELTDGDIAESHQQQKEAWRLEFEEQEEEIRQLRSTLTEPKKGNVYVMLNAKNGHYKIGFTTKEPKFREQTLQSQEPEVQLIKAWIGTEQDEIELHEIFRAKRIRGEWFSLRKNDLTKIENYFKSNALETKNA